LIQKKQGRLRSLKQSAITSDRHFVPIKWLLEQKSYIFSQLQHWFVTAAISI
jgi:hypothetical protein